MKNLLSFLGAAFFATVLFATASAQVSVSVVGSATSSVTPIVQNVDLTNLPINNAQLITSGMCPNLINNYHKIGASGVEVAKLQNFLNQVNGAKLNGKGYFGPVTQQEVRNFQYTYGIKATGHQYVLTTKMINDINCGKVTKKDRRVYSLASSYVIKSSAISGATTMGTVSKNLDLVKEYKNPSKINLIGTGTKATVTMATKTSFWENLNKDWKKVQENYKAYLLVFALVLALFWFLRKAATE